MSQGSRMTFKFFCTWILKHSNSHFCWRQTELNRCWCCCKNIRGTSDMYTNAAEQCWWRSSIQFTDPSKYKCYVRAYNLPEGDVEDKPIPWDSGTKKAFSTGGEKFVKQEECLIQINLKQPSKTTHSAVVLRPGEKVFNLLRNMTGSHSYSCIALTNYREWLTLWLSEGSNFLFLQTPF